jgi:hypothetical protein
VRTELGVGKGTVGVGLRPMSPLLPIVMAAAVLLVALALFPEPLNSSCMLGWPLSGSHLLTPLPWPCLHLGGSAFTGRCCCCCLPHPHQASGWAAASAQASRQVVEVPEG